MFLSCFFHVYLVTGSDVSVLVCDMPMLCPHLHPLLHTLSNQETENVPPQSKRLQAAQPVTSFVKDLTDKHTVHAIWGHNNMIQMHELKSLHSFKIFLNDLRITVVLTTLGARNTVTFLYVERSTWKHTSKNTNAHIWSTILWINDILLLYEMYVR